MKPKHTIPEYILPAQHRPTTHHRPDIIMVVGYTYGPDGKIIKDPTYKGRRQLQIIECKYSTDGNIQEIINHILTIYEPLKQALQHHGTLKAVIVIILIVISRTRTFHVKTLAEIAQLVYYTEEPPNTLTYKQLPRPAQKMPWPSTSTPKNGSHTYQESQEKSSPQNRITTLIQQALRLERS
jgi:hypothetical protein